MQHTDISHTPFYISIQDIPTGWVAWLTLIAIVAGLIISVLTIVNNRNVAKKTTALKLLDDEQTNEIISKKREAFLELKNGSKIKLVTHAQNYYHGNKEEKDIAFKSLPPIKATLNRYEMIAIGIEEGIVCERTYKNWIRRTVIDDWEALKETVKYLRDVNKNPNLYEHFQKMAEKFAKSKK